MSGNNPGLSKADKLLLTIYEMIQQNALSLKYEDIFVAAFKGYPDDFHLRGYREYPDTGDATQRPLYSLRKAGYIRVNNKFVKLTEKGRTFAERLAGKEKPVADEQKNKLSRDVEVELSRIRNTDAFQLFLAGRQEELVDTDFFAYLGTTVRTDRSDFGARVKTIDAVIETIKKTKAVKDRSLMIELHNYLLNKFRAVMNKKLSSGLPRRKNE